MDGIIFTVWLAPGMIFVIVSAIAACWGPKKFENEWSEPRCFETVA